MIQLKAQLEVLKIYSNNCFISDKEKANKYTQEELRLVTNTLKSYE